MQSRKNIKKRRLYSKRSKINYDTKFTDDLGMDSLEKYEFNYLIENEFDIRIPDKKMKEFETVRNYIDYIQNYKKL